jgi:hypothetical protein
MLGQQFRVAVLPGTPHYAYHFHLTTPWSIPICESLNWWA